jgi:hypothetical protein
MRISDWLVELDTVEPVGAGFIDALGERLEQVATAACSQVARSGVVLEPGALRLPKSRLADLGRCERFAVATWRDRSDSDAVAPAALAGMALDRFVLHQVAQGRVLEPVAALRSMLIAQGEWAALDALDRLDAADSDAAAQLLDPLASSVADSWAGIDPRWLPRAQVRATVGLADWRVVCSGIVDIELGGPAVDRPTVLVEVKSGAPTAGHLAEVALYALLVALRDRHAPVAVARWYPGSGPAGAIVTEGFLESAARRLADGISLWAELVAGRQPVERPGAWCAWCADSSVCASASLGGPLDEGPCS